MEPSYRRIALSWSSSTISVPWPYSTSPSRTANGQSRRIGLQPYRTPYEWTNIYGWHDSPRYRPKGAVCTSTACDAACSPSRRRVMNYRKCWQPTGLFVEHHPLHFDPRHMCLLGPISDPGSPALLMKTPLSWSGTAEIPLENEDCPAGCRPESPKVGENPDPAALSIVWRAALGVLVPCTSMRPFISLSCSREHDRLKGGASVLCLVPGAVMR
jgi:hypothetical protein